MQISSPQRRIAVRRAVMKVFWSKILNDLVVGEKCECGHLKNSHKIKIKKIIRCKLGEFSKKNSSIHCCNKGKCRENNCDCKKYVFSKVITLTEILELVENNNRITQDKILTINFGEKKVNYPRLFRASHAYSLRSLC